MGWSLAHHSLLSSFDVSSAYWVVLYSLLLLGFVRLSWHGVSRPSLRRGRLVLWRTIRATAAIVLVVSALCATALGAPRPGARNLLHAYAHPSTVTVTEVQRLFHVLGYPLGRERAGTFGVRTKGALSYFQHKYGLPITGYPDARTVAEMQAVAASLSAAPASGRPPPRDLVDRLLGGVPPMGLGLACALGLALLALAASRRDVLSDRVGLVVCSTLASLSEPLVDELRARFPRVAVVHEWLTVPGGSEQVVLELLEMFPQAELFTLDLRPRPVAGADHRAAGARLLPEPPPRGAGPLPEAAAADGPRLPRLRPFTLRPGPLEQPRVRQERAHRPRRAARVLLPHPDALRLGGGLPRGRGRGAPHACWRCRCCWGACAARTSAELPPRTC